MIVFRAHLQHPVLARMSSHQAGPGLDRASSRLAPQQTPAAVDASPDEPTEEELLAERMSFFESSYELSAGCEVSESTWAEALDICPDSGWPPLAPLPLPPRTRTKKR